MAHKAGLILGQITLHDYRVLSKLKPEDPEAYERMERKLGTTRAQLVRKYGRKDVEEAEYDPVRKKMEILRKEGGRSEKQVEAIGYSYGRYVRFGTRKDGRRYPKR